MNTQRSWLDDPCRAWAYRLGNLIIGDSRCFDGVTLERVENRQYIIVIDAPDGKQRRRRFTGKLEKIGEKIAAYIQAGGDLPDETPSDKPARSFKKTSHYFGVSLNKRTQQWRVRVRIPGETVELGQYPDQHTAARVYNAYVIEHGLEKRLNRVPEGK